MNLNKFNFYKNCKYFLLGALLILLAGLVVGICVGLNLVEALGASTIVWFSLAMLISMALLFVYLSVRYDDVSAFVFVSEIFLNIALTTALCAIIRIPVGVNFVCVLALIVVVTLIMNIFVFAKVKAKKTEKTDRAELVNQIVKNSFKEIIFIAVVLILGIVASLFILDIEVIMFVRPMLVGLVITTLVTIFISTPVWGYFYKDKPKKKKIAEVDGTVYVDGEQELPEQKEAVVEENIQEIKE